MSALLQFPSRWVPQQAMATGTVDICAAAAIQPHLNPSLLATAVHHIQRRIPPPELELVPDLEPCFVEELLQDSRNQGQPNQKVLDPDRPGAEPDSEPDSEVDSELDSEPINTWAFYRKHTESLLRRYLYASMQVGRSPNLLGESVGRGWVSSRRVRTFEDALIFVLDVERCLTRLALLERQLITRRVLQEYTHQETAIMLGLNLRTLNDKLFQALDHLTEILVSTDLLVLPD